MNRYKNYKRTIFSWSIYDFANQPFTTIILTFVYSTFFVDFISPSGEEGAIMLGRAITISSHISQVCLTLFAHYVAA